MRICQVDCGECFRRNSSEVTRQKYAKYAIALPETYEELVRRKVPWIASKKLSLEILLVSSKGTIRRINWQGLKMQTD